MILDIVNIAKLVFFVQEMYNIGLYWVSQKPFCTCTTNNKTTSFLVLLLQKIAYLTFDT